MRVPKGQLVFSRGIALTTQHLPPRAGLLHVDSAMSRAAPPVQRSVSFPLVDRPELHNRRQRVSISRRRVSYLDSDPLLYAMARPLLLLRPWSKDTHPTVLPTRNCAKLSRPGRPTALRRDKCMGPCIHAALLTPSKKKHGTGLSPSSLRLHKDQCVCVPNHRSLASLAEKYGPEL